MVAELSQRGGQARLAEAHREHAARDRAQVVQRGRDLPLGLRRASVPGPRPAARSRRSAPAGRRRGGRARGGCARRPRGRRRGAGPPRRRRSRRAGGPARRRTPARARTTWAAAPTSSGSMRGSYQSSAYVAPSRVSRRTARSTGASAGRPSASMRLPSGRRYVRTSPGSAVSRASDAARSAGAGVASSTVRATRPAVRRRQGQPPHAAGGQHQDDDEPRVPDRRLPGVVEAAVQRERVHRTGGGEGAEGEGRGRHGLVVAAGPRLAPPAEDGADHEQGAGEHQRHGRDPVEHARRIPTARSRAAGSWDRPSSRSRRGPGRPRAGARRPSRRRAPRCRDAAASLRDGVRATRAPPRRRRRGPGEWPAGRTRTARRTRSRR